MKDLKISKELLIEVLGSEYKQRLVDWFQIEDDNFLRTYYDCGSYDDKGRPTGLGLEINIYEFAFKCKEWAFKNKYKIQSQINESNKGHSHITKKNDDCWAKGFFENTEIEAIIKASEYILKEVNENR